MPTEGKTDLPQAAPLHEDIPESELVPEEVPVVVEVLPTPKAEPTPMSALVQTVSDLQPDGMVYVPSFGWLESQGRGEVIYAEDMYENGNKIGFMG